ncbi:lysozyme [Nesidiocoris tenuis]|nr:lysozyme [Nesidiocoris tenuis]
MSVFANLFLLFTLFLNASSVSYTPCEFAAELAKPRYKIVLWQIPTWVCLAHHASNLTASYKSMGYHGLFRISNIWCSRCPKLCDGSDDRGPEHDIECAVNVVYKTHHGELDGFHGWGDWYTEYCLNPYEELNKFDCKLNVTRLINTTDHQIGVGGLFDSGSTFYPMLFMGLAFVCLMTLFAFLCYTPFSYKRMV